MIASHSLAIAISGVTAALILFGTIRWWFEAVERVWVAEAFRPTWFRSAQFGLALGGMAAAIVEFAYLSYFAASGRVWRRWRVVTWIFAVLASLWTAVWILDRFVLDQIFID